MANQNVSIIIPNWNGYHLLRQHMPAVVEASMGCEIIVVDDYSTDESVQFLKATYKKVRVIEKDTHDGFASTVNKGVIESSGNIVVLLNTDVEPQKDFIRFLLPHFTDEKIFAVGCLEKSVEHERVVLRGRGIARWYRGFYIHSRGEVNQCDTAWVSGGSGAFRKTTWDILGGMDQAFNPFYWEDIDLSYRALKAGYRIYFEPKSIVIHSHEQGSIQQSFRKESVHVVAYRNQFLFIWKNVTDVRIIFSHVVWVPIRLLQAVLRGDMPFIQGFMEALQRFFDVIEKRHQYKHLLKKRDSDIVSVVSL